MKRKRRMLKLARIIKPFIQEKFCVFLNIVSFQKLRIIHARWQVRRYIQKIDGAGTKTSVFVVLNWCRTWRSWSPGKSVVWNLFAIVCFFQAVQLMNQFVNRWIWRTLLLLMPLQKVFPYDSLSTANVSLLSTLGLHSFRGGSFNTMSSRFSRTSANFSQARSSTLLQIISIWSTMLQTKESMSGSIMQWVDRYPSTLEQMLTEIVWCSAVQFISWRGLRNLKRRTKGIISHWQARTHRIPISLSKIVLGEMYIHTIKPVNGSSGAILLMSVYVIKTIKMYVASVTLVLKVRRELSDVRQMIFKQIRINCYVELASRLVHGLGGTVFFHVKNVTLTPKHPSKGAIWSRSRGDVRETNGQFSVLF